ncbi:uncharacterized protein LOC126896510 isoform X5 [Daktulosphaira vitifoliae]|uniref:uncharacterized protein LOC126896510 isoform X5 n=1 Tax=Daktulosphaira vitifoliae TaxID=58002 RepID=UPI0021AA3B09|nr:uncharacterized protein LOC126896510 isoform X5 [Daktulosphaira vitifoliae]
MKEFYIFLILFILILITETKFNSRFKTDILNRLIANDGWKNLKDVSCIAYFQKAYYLEELLETTELINCNNRIRLLTLFLACSYVRDLKTLFFIFMEFRKHCSSLNKKSDPKATGYDCAIELLKNLQKMPSLATLMKETLYVLDYLHTDPWKDAKKDNFILKKLLLILENFNEKIRNYLPLKNDSKVTKNFFEFIQTYFIRNNTDIKYYCFTVCQFVSIDTEFLWLNMIKEYNYITNNDNTLQFYDYLSQKVNLIFNSIIINKFHKLGFQHDPNTLQIGIPLPNKYITVDLQFYTRPNETSTTIETVSQRNVLENQWILELIDSFNKDLDNVSEPIKELQLIDFIGQDLVDVSENNKDMQQINCIEQDLVNVSEPYNELQLIDFIGKDLVNESEPNEELQLIDFFGQGLNPDDSYDDISEPMETDENRENFTKYL